MKRKPKKWFIYTRLILSFLIIFTVGKTTNVVYSAIVTDNNNENKKLSQAIIIDNKEGLYAEENSAMLKYTSVPEKGFEVTTGNKTYELSEEEYDEFVAIIAGESNTNINDILAVVTVVLNRSDASGYSPLEVLKRPGQFASYFDGCYYKYLDENGKVRYAEKVEEVVKDALYGGIRNNHYYSFRSWSTTSYSDNYVVYMGNRFN